jgi:hypothetical protein
VFSEALPPYDDVGFTHDNLLAIGRRDGDTYVGGSIMTRWITSGTDRRRWDQIDILAVGERALPHRIHVTGRFGPTLGGDFGGMHVQSWFHGVSGTGPTVDEGLANDYPDSRRIAALIGGRARGQLGEDAVHAYGHIDGQLALGNTGITSFELGGGGRGTWRHLGAHVELAITGYHTRDPNLALPAGYDPGVHFEWRAGVDVAWSRYRIAYQYRANEGGSGQPIGGVAFAFAY